MKKTSVTVSFDEEKLYALKMYLEQKSTKVEDELEKSLESLYAKNVPAGVRDFIEMKTGRVSSVSPKQRNRKQTSHRQELQISDNEEKGSS